jgi:hypothetical protein
VFQTFLLILIEVLALVMALWSLGKLFVFLFLRGFKEA